MKDGYGIFLMIELARLAGIIPQELEYDITWEMGNNLYDEFKASSFDDSFEPEYECIQNFLNTKKNPITNICKLRQDLIDEELWVFGIHEGIGLDGSKDYEYRWLNDNEFQINVDGNWIEYHSIDFDF